MFHFIDAGILKEILIPISPSIVTKSFANASLIGWFRLSNECHTILAMNRYLLSTLNFSANYINISGIVS
jgi:hypothetical protein